MLIGTRNHLFALLSPLIHADDGTQNARFLVNQLPKVLNAEVKYMRMPVLPRLAIRPSLVFALELQRCSAALEVFSSS
jgi:hypothetical protein